MEFKYLNIAFFTLVQCLVVHLNGQSEKGSHSVDSICISNHIVYSAEELTTKPIPPGGFMVFRENLKDSIVFPQSAIENGIAGRVSLTFVVCPKGEIHQLEVVKSKSIDCDAEAIRVLKSMGKWQSGQKDEESVYSKVRYSVNFRKPED